jgi:hypothetical protein
MNFSTLYHSGIIERIPLILFILLKKFTAFSWPMLFVICGSLSILVLLLVTSQKRIIQTSLIFLSTNLFLILAALLFVINYEPLLLLFESYKGAFFFAPLLLVAILTTLFSEYGFLNVASSDKQKNFLFSSVATSATFIAFLWSIVFAHDSLFNSIVIPFIIVRIVCILLAKRVPHQDSA